MGNFLTSSGVTELGSPRKDFIFCLSASSMLPYVSMCRIMPAQVRDSMLALNAVSRGKDGENINIQITILPADYCILCYFRDLLILVVNTESLKIW